MLGYILRRLLLVITTFIGITIIVFTLSLSPYCIPALFILSFFPMGGFCSDEFDYFTWLIFDRNHFQYRWFGLLGYESLIERDYPVVMGIR
jgi:ABC-type microcin C transport system permease subunit YejB